MDKISVLTIMQWENIENLSHFLPNQHILNVKDLVWDNWSQNHGKWLFIVLFHHFWPQLTLGKGLKMKLFKMPLIYQKRLYKFFKS